MGHVPSSVNGNHLLPVLMTFSERRDCVSHVLEYFRFPFRILASIWETRNVTHFLSLLDTDSLLVLSILFERRLYVHIPLTTSEVRCVFGLVLRDP